MLIKINFITFMRTWERNFDLQRVGNITKIIKFSVSLKHYESPSSRTSRITNDFRSWSKHASVYLYLAIYDLAKWVKLIIKQLPQTWRNQKYKLKWCHSTAFKKQITRKLLLGNKINQDYSKFQGLGALTIKKYTVTKLVC